MSSCSLDPRLLFVCGKESLVRTVCACVKNPVKLSVKFIEHGGVHVGSVRIIITNTKYKYRALKKCTVKVAKIALLRTYELSAR